VSAEGWAARADGAFVAASARLASGVTLAPGAVIHAGVPIGEDTSVGSGAVVHAGTVVGAQCVIEDGAVLGKRPRLRPGSSAAAGGALDPLHVGDGVTICCGAVVYAGARLADRVIIGDQAQVRERSVLGAGSVLGRGSTIDFEASVGERVLIQTLVYVTGGSIVEDDVFIGPGVTTTNDHAMGRHARGEALLGPIFRRACRVGGGVVLTPGVEIGEEAFIAAGAVVTRGIAAREVVMGVPGRVVREIADDDLLERWR
jgi:acetyltransferase-like isoleucine patch superfamily enzyme